MFFNRSDAIGYIFITVLCNALPLTAQFYGHKKTVCLYVRACMYV